MRRPLIFILALVFIAALLSFTVTYTVKFTEAAVVTTFGKASEDSVQRDPGLRFKLPYPIQSVTTYDTRMRFLQARLETQQTADNRQIVVEAFCTWRVSDPLVFFQRFSNAGDRADDHYRQAENTIRNNLRSALSQVSRYRMDEFFTADPAGSKLPDLERGVLEALRAGDQSAQSLSAYGVEAVAVGVNRVLLPQETSKKAIERMVADRDRLVAEIESQGESQAQTIRSAARSDADKIMAFARQLAEQIRAKGEIEAGQYLAQMNREPELAAYLRALEFIAQAYTKQTTLVLPSTLPGMNLFMPDALNNVREGQVPSINPDLPSGLTPASASGSAGEQRVSSRDPANERPAPEPNP